MATWSALVGARRDDKATALGRVLAKVEEAGVRVGGFAQERVLDAAGETLGWDVVRIGAPVRQPLARRGEQPDVCDYAFSALGFETAAAWALDARAELVVVGGVGKLEAAGRGHSPLLLRLLEEGTHRHALFCIRDTSLAAVALSIPDPESHLQLPCEPSQLDEFADGLVELVRASHRRA